MAISGDYSTPVTVNGFSCRNCTEVDLANKHIDPAHPKDGPFGINADANRDPLKAHKSPHGPAFRLDERLLARLHPERSDQPRATSGSTLDIRA